MITLEYIVADMCRCRFPNAKTSATNCEQLHLEKFHHRISVQL